MHSKPFFSGEIPVHQFANLMYLNKVYQSLLELGFAARAFSRISYSHSDGRGLGGCRRNRQWRRFTEWLLEGAGREKHRIVWPRNSETWTLRDSLELNKRKITMLDWILVPHALLKNCNRAERNHRPYADKGSCDWFGKPPSFWLSLFLPLSFWPKLLR